MILIISTCKEPLHKFEFVKPIEDILEKNKIRFFTKHYSKITKEDLNKADKIIITGTSLKDNQFLEDKNHFNFVRDINKPILGICAGMQIIGLIFKGKLKKQKEIGIVEVNFKKKFIRAHGSRKIYCLHGNSVEFGDKFEVFAKTKIPQAVKHKQKEIYGTLFHPEVRNKEIIERFIIK